MSVDALSIFANQNPAQLVWATKFAGVTLASPVRSVVVDARDWNSAISGTDTLTGHGFTTDADLQAFFGPTAYFRLQHINASTDPKPESYSGDPKGAAYDLVTYFDNSIDSSTDLISTPGAGQLSLNNLVVTPSGASQSVLMMERSAPSSVNYNQDEFYYTGVYQFPVGMNLDASGKYLAFFEVKGGALKQSLVNAVVNGSVRDGSSCAATDGVANAGKFRITIQINGYYGTNAIQIRLDDGANNGGLTIPNAYYDETGYHESGTNPYAFFITDSTSILPSGVPLGVPLRFHVHYKRPPTPLYADRHKGIFKVAMENLATSEWFMLCDIENSSLYQLSSTFNEPWSRFFPTMYSSMANSELKMTDLQIWNKPPIRLSPDPEPEILSRHILVDPVPGVGHEIYGVLASSQAQDVFRQAWESGGDMQPASAQAARPDSGYPVIESVTETTFTVDSVNHAVAMPATVNAGDGLLVFLTLDGDSIPTTPDDWDKLYGEAYSTSVTGCAYALVATGTEGGTTVNFVTSAAEKGAAQVYRISNWNGTLGGFHNGIVAENGTGSTTDLPAITAYWESAKTLWIGALHTSTSQTVSSAPTNYTDLTQTTSGGATTDGQCITARRFNETATEDPGVFTMSGTGAAKVYNTIAIAPAYVGPSYERFEVTRDSITLWQGLYTTQDHTVADANITRAVIVVHGKSLDAAEYHNVVAHNMRDYLGNTIVLAPFYERNVERADVDQLFWGSSWPQLGRSSSLLPWRISSGEIMDLLIAHLYATFPNLEGVIIAGHSAGGQFCNRYSMASTDPRNRFLVSAPSSYAYPGPHRMDSGGGWVIPSSPSTFDDWKYGLADLSSVSYAEAIGAANLKSRFVSAKVHYMVGALDTDPASSSLDVTASAMLQGSQRVERQSNFHEYIRFYNIWR